jgi:O-antigen/teichoic acid export membrane protein
MIIASSLFPAIVRAKEVDEGLFYVRLQRLFTALVWMAILAAVAMTFLGEWVITLLYGEAFRGAGKVLMVHAWAGVFVSMGVASSSWLASENLQRYAFYRTFLGAVVNVLLNLVLIPAMGMIGAAIATVVAQATAAWISDVFTARTRVMFLMKLRTFYFADLNRRA